MTVPYRFTSLEEVSKLAKACGERIFVDLETLDLYGEIRLLQAYHPSFDAVLLVDRPTAQEVAALLEAIPHAWHNAHYDITTIQKHTCSRWVPNDYDDTFLLARLKYARELVFSLDAVFIYVLGYCPYSKAFIDKKEMQKSDWTANTLTDKQLLYAAIDVYYMPHLWNEVKDYRNELSYTLDKLTLNYCFDFQWNGMPLNNELVVKEKQRINERLLEIDLPVNACSPKQVKEYLQVENSQGLTLATIVAKKEPRAKEVSEVIEVRKLRKLLSFLTKWNNPRVYGYFKPSTRSGRLASEKDNLQQIPNALKKVFEAPEGKVFLYSDFSTAQLRGACAITADRNMEKVLRSGDDLHNYAKEMMGLEEWMRQVAKTCNFNLLFGGSARMLQGILIKVVGLYFTVQQCQAFRTKWLKLWPEIARWQRQRSNNHRRGKTDSTPFGREYLGKLYTDQMNIEVQGFEAEFAKLALHYMYNDVKQLGGVMCDMVHDNYIVEADDDPKVYEPIAAIIGNAMQESWVEACKGLPIPDLPMPVTVKVGKNWGDLENDKNVIYKLEL